VSSAGGQPDRRLGLAGLVVALIVVLAAAGAVGLLLARRPETAPIEIRPPAPTATPLPTATPAPWRVYVTGAVRHPGVVTVAPAARVEDAVRAAGGPADEADLERINLAAPVYDGQHLRVPAVGEEFSVTDEGLASPGVARRVNINLATVAELDTLPGIGEVTAAKIVAYRQQHGPFRTIEAIMDVSGIGEAKFEAIKALITVGP
jgi:competence protein ComEA